MQWLYNFLHSIWTYTSSFYGFIFWAVKKFLNLQVTLWTGLIVFFVLFWRLFHFALSIFISKSNDLATPISGVSSVGSLGDVFSFVNCFFPVTEAMEMMAFIASYGLSCITIRVVRAFIPTMT